MKTDPVPETHLCERCENIFPTLLHLQHHKCVSQVIYPCEICEFKSHSTMELLAHVDDCHRTKVIQCTYCDFKTKDQASVDEHMETDHGTRAICGECGDSFPEQKVCEEHMKSKHSIEDRAVLMSCKTCDLVCANPNELRHHMEDHIAPAGKLKTNCDQCEYKSKSGSELAAHVILNHRRYN